jgi:hypothetical protein
MAFIGIVASFLGRHIDSDSADEVAQARAALPESAMNAIRASDHFFTQV